MKEKQTGEGYPKYRRLAPDEGGFTVNMEGVEVHNGWVVPYNTVLLCAFNAHINVEMCISVKSIKSINKGSDQEAFALHNKSDKVDEVSLYESGHYISNSEDVQRIIVFPNKKCYPAAIHLVVHLENGQHVYLTSNNLAEKENNPWQTTLTFCVDPQQVEQQLFSAFFNPCKEDEFCKPSVLQWSSILLCLKR